MIFLYIFVVIILLLFIFIVYNKMRKNFVHCLMYHSVDGEKDKGGIFVEEFEEQMKIIQNKKSFRMKELKKMDYKLPKNSILVTFDDGYKNNFTLAYPILKKYNIKATIFLNTRYVGKNEDYLSWDEVREMYESGLVDFQMHTHSHDLTVKKIKVVDFYGEKDSPYFKRESFNLFFDGTDGNYSTEKDSHKLDGLPIFKLVSKVSIPGFRPRLDFVQKFRQIENSPEFIKKTKNEKIEFLNKMFLDRQSEFFEKVSQDEFKRIVKYEITENKKIIGERIGQIPFVFAYPWGHRYAGNCKDLEKLGVEVFVTTRKGANSLKLNKHWIYRISGDDFSSLLEFENALKDGSNAIYRKMLKKIKKNI